MSDDPMQRLRKLVAAGAAGLALAYMGVFALMLHSHVWILRASGRPRVANFLFFWLAGKSALSGHAHAAYNANFLHTAQEEAAGYKFSHYFLWNYPPHYFFIAGAFAILPYLPAFLSWVAGTLVCYAATMASVARSRVATIVSCAAPAVYINAISGENGYLTAALIGFFLLALETNSVLAGVLLGFLTIKPQLGIMIPVALVAASRWRVFITAAVCAVLCLSGAMLVFGEETIRAFVLSLPMASRYVLQSGSNGWNNLQSLYGLMRWLGFADKAAWAAQLCLAMSVAGALVWLWRRPISFALKAAALALACLLASPYLYIYDFVTLSVVFAFLYRQRAFDVFEIASIALANLCVGSFLFLPTPIGLAGAFIAAVLIARRAMHPVFIEARPLVQGGVEPAQV
jgi:arabinofuranan 3-O-arabinosyltransferase